MAIDPRFEYSTYERNIFATREELTGLARIILDTKANIFTVIVNTIRVAALLALFKIRQNMMEEEMMLNRQIYMRKRADLIDDDLDDNLDGRKP